MTPKPTLDVPSARYEAFRHVELAQAVERDFKPEIAHRIADDWKTIGKALTELAVDFSVIITGSKDGWTGSAAEGARNALLKVGEFSDTTGDHFLRTSEAVREQTHAAGEAKARMPPPVDFDPRKMFSDAVRSGNPLEVMALPFAIPAQKAKADAARAEAVDVMYARDDALYSATLGMPALAEPPKVTQEQGVTTTSSHTPSVDTRAVDTIGRTGTGTTGTTSTPTAATTSPTGTTPVADTGGTTRTSWTPPTLTTPPPPLTPPAYHQPPTSPPVPPPGVLPPGRRPGGSTPPGAVRTPQGSPHGGGRGMNGRPGVGMPVGGGAGQARTPGFGPTGSTGGTPFGPTGGQGDAARRTTPVGPGAAAGAPAGGQGGEDQEHQTKYLIPTDEYFDDKRMVAPETIGE